MDLNMNLSAFLDKHQLTHQQFADMIGVTRPLVTALVNKKANPSSPVTRRIEIVTNGEVLFSDLYIEVESKRIKKKIYDKELRVMGG